jgi:hypothetical protein
MKSKWILITSFAAALSMAVPGMAQVPAANTIDQAKSSTKKKAVEACSRPSYRRPNLSSVMGAV